KPIGLGVHYVAGKRGVKTERRNERGPVVSHRSADRSNRTALRQAAGVAMIEQPAKPMASANSIVAFDTWRHRSVRCRALGDSARDRYGPGLARRTAPF